MSATKKQPDPYVVRVAVTGEPGRGHTTVAGEIGAALAALGFDVTLHDHSDYPTWQAIVARPNHAESRAKMAHSIKIELRTSAVQRKPRTRKVARCPDCGVVGERKGHMGCQYPRD